MKRGPELHSAAGPPKVQLFLMETSPEGQPANRCLAGFYAVVAYIPDPLGSFLNELRAELVPGCTLRSHITILPPRRLTAPDAAIRSELDRLSSSLPVFEVILGDVEVFPSTGVVYLSLAGGRQSVEHAHASLNHGVLFAEDVFPFHPHVTIAQNLGSLPFEEVLGTARRRWQECRFPRQFAVEELTLVRNVSPSCWEDLSRHRLSPVSLLRTA